MTIIGEGFNADSSSSTPILPPKKQNPITEFAKGTIPTNEDDGARPKKRQWEGKMGAGRENPKIGAAIEETKAFDERKAENDSKSSNEVSGLLREKPQKVDERKKNENREDFARVFKDFSKDIEVKTRQEQALCTHLLELHYAVDELKKDKRKTLMINDNRQFEAVPAKKVKKVESQLAFHRGINLIKQASDEGRHSVAIKTLKGDHINLRTLLDRMVSTPGARALQENEQFAKQFTQKTESARESLQRAEKMHLIADNEEGEKETSKGTRSRSLSHAEKVLQAIQEEYSKGEEKLKNDLRQLEGQLETGSIGEKEATSVVERILGDWMDMDRVATEEKIRAENHKLDLQISNFAVEHEHVPIKELQENLASDAKKLAKWAKKLPELCRAYDSLKAIQEELASLQKSAIVDKATDSSGRPQMSREDRILKLQEEIHELEVNPNEDAKKMINLKKELIRKLESELRGIKANHLKIRSYQANIGRLTSDIGEMETKYKVKNEFHAIYDKTVNNKLTNDRRIKKYNHYREDVDKLNTLRIEDKDVSHGSPEKAACDEAKIKDSALNSVEGRAKLRPMELAATFNEDGYPHLHAIIQSLNKVD